MPVKGGGGGSPIKNIRHFYGNIPSGSTSVNVAISGIDDYTKCSVAIKCTGISSTTTQGNLYTMAVTLTSNTQATVQRASNSHTVYFEIEIIEWQNVKSFQSFISASYTTSYNVTISSVVPNKSIIIFQYECLSGSGMGWAALDNATTIGCYGHDGTTKRIRGWIIEFF